MKVNATSAGKMIDLRDRCGKLHMSSNCPEEQELLSAIYMVLSQGGSIFAKPAKGRKPVRVKWDR